MQCPACRTDNPAGMKFCGECAAPLRNRCARCGFENPPGFKFCGECAAPLGAGARAGASARPSNPAAGIAVRITPETSPASVPEGERKTVTALFADIKGSMDLMEDRDPEDARAIIDPALALMMEAVHRYDGYVVQSTGDGVFALFGAPLAHEDHPQRALYAALRMQDEMRRYAAKLREHGEPPIEIRIGVNTGETVIRSIRTDDAHAEYTPIGHSMSLAARMQTLAPSGAIVITGQTQKQVAGYFALNALGPARIKGVSEPVDVFEVAGLGPLRTRLQRSALRGLSRFVGRSAELGQMRAVAERAREGHGQIVAAVAEAGVGKSRLFHEFRQGAPDGWLVLEAFSVSHGRASAYLPVIEMLKGYFRIVDTDDERIRREKVTGRLLALDRALDDTMPFLFALLGIGREDPALEGMDGAIRRRRTQGAIKNILLRESINQPLMLIFEDLHWIDSETEALLGALADSIATARILMLVNYRPEYRHDWGGKSHYTQLRLDPLRPEDAAEMLEAMLGTDAALGAVKDMIVRRTEGNPFFMEEMVQELLEEGVLVRDPALRLARPMESVRVPDTVKGILASRIDRLPPAHKELLQTLSVIGKEFPLDLVRRVSPMADDELSTMMSALQTAEFIYEQPAIADVEYVFKHALTQEVAYDSVLMERRREVHERTASAIEELYPTQVSDRVDELANHYSRSGNAPKAVGYLQRAAQQARERSAYADAVGHLRKGLEMLHTLPESPERDRTQLGFYISLGTAVANLRGFTDPEMGTILARASELSQRLGDAPAIIEVLLGTWNLEFSRGTLGKALGTAQRILNLAIGTGDDGLISNTHAAVGSTSLWLGRFEDARSHLSKVIEIHDRDLPRYLPMAYAPVVPSRCQIAWALWCLGYADQARDRVNEALTLARQLGRPFSMGFALQNSVAVLAFRREYAEMRSLLEAQIENAREHGLRYWLATGIMSMGRLLVHEGKTDEGMPMLREGLATLLNGGAGLIYSFGQVLFADSCLEADMIDEGLHVSEEALNLIERNDSRLQESEAHRLRGEFLLRAGGRDDEARDAISRAIEVARHQGAKSWELRATMSMARLMDREGQGNEARAMLSEIYDWFTEGRATADHIEAAALLKRLAA